VCLSLMSGRLGVTACSLVLGILLDYACTAAFCLLSGSVLGECHDNLIMLFSPYLLFSQLPVGLYVNFVYLHSCTTLLRVNNRTANVRTTQNRGTLVQPLLQWKCNKY
jgi:hypothetical protein